STEGSRARPLRRLVAVAREVHVVLGRAGPVAAPAPADRAEGRDDRGRHHALPQPRPIEVAGPGRIARLTTPDIRVLGRVEVDREAVSMVLPGARSLAARDRR